MIKLLLLTLLLAITSLTAFAQTTPAPTGFSEQRFCHFESHRVSDITVTGSDIKWYDAATGGNLIPSTYDLNLGQDYFASQTISGIESTTRLKVRVWIEFPINNVFPIGNTTFCEGGSVDIVVSGGYNYPNNASEMMYNVIYQWNKDGQFIYNNGSNNIYTATQSGNYSAMQITNWVNSTNGTMHDCGSQSSPIQITVNPNPTATITPVGSTTISTSGSVVLNASTGTGYTYQWFKDGTSITGATTSSYTATQSGSYTVKVSNSSTTCNSTSTATVVTVNTANVSTPSITPQGATTFCEGGSVVLNSSTGTGYTYEWYKNGSIITGSTTSSYTATQSGSYTVKVSNGSSNATSIATVVTVNPNPTTTITAGGATTFCQGGTVVLNASTGTGFTYEWYKNGSIINGSTTSSYTANQSGSYTVKVINGACNATSLVKDVLVNPNPIASLSLSNYIHINAIPITLVGSPIGGTYSGPGVVGNTFSSTNASLGKKNITYKYTSNTGCIGTAVATTTVFDTTVCSTIDTLFIKIAVTGLTSPNNIGTLKIWPNPASDHITIDNGKLSILNGYSVKIETVLGQEVFKSAINQQQFSIDLSTWKGKGTYFIHIIDNQNNIIETKKIVLQ